VKVGVVDEITRVMLATVSDGRVVTLLVLEL
jgi:hypothetical protein